MMFPSLVQMALLSLVQMVLMSLVHMVLMSLVHAVLLSLLNMVLLSLGSHGSLITDLPDTGSHDDYVTCSLGTGSPVTGSLGASVTGSHGASVTSFQGVPDTSLHDNSVTGTAVKLFVNKNYSPVFWVGGVYSGRLGAMRFLLVAVTHSLAAQTKRTR
jgi:hypothetical protein